MALNSLGLGVIFSARDLASPVIRQVTSGLLGLNGAASRVSSSVADKLGISTAALTASMIKLAGGVAAAAAGIAGLKVLFGDTVKEAASLEDIMLQIQQKTNFADSSIVKLRDDFLLLSASLPLSAQELAKVGVIAGQLGIQTTEGVKALAFQASQLARASAFTEETAAAALARLSKLFALNIAEANKLGSSLVKLANTTTATAPGIVEITKRFAGMAKVAGLTADQANAFSATLIDAGVSAEAAGSSMTRVLAAATTRSAAFAKQMGITEDQFKAAFGRDAAGTLARFFATFQGLDKFQVQGRLKTLGLSSIRVQQAVFGLANQAQALVKNLATSSKAFREGTELQRAFEARTKSLNAQLDTLRGSFKNLLIAIGNELIPVVKSFVQLGVEFLSLLLSIPAPVRKILVTFAAVGSVVAVVTGLGLAFAALLPVIKAVGAAVFAAVGVPFAKVLAVIAIVTAAVVALKTAFEANFGGIRDAVAGFIEPVRLAFRSLVALFTKGEISGALAKDLLKAENRGVFRFVETVSKAVASIQAFFRGFGQVVGRVFSNVSLAFKPVFAELKVAGRALLGAFFEIFGAIAELLGLQQPGAEGIKTIEDFSRVLTAFVTGPVETVVVAFAKVAGVFAKIIRGAAQVFNFLSRGFRTIASIVGAAFQTILGIFTGNVAAIAQGISKMINGVIDSLNQLVQLAIKVGSILPGVSEETLIKLSKLKFDRVTPSKVAFAFGGSAKLIRTLADQEKRIIQAQRGANPIPTPGTPGASPRGAPGAPGTAPPSPTTPAGQPAPVVRTPTGPPAPAPARTGGTLTTADVIAILDAFERRTQAMQDRPVQIRGNVSLNGRTVGEIRAEEERDARARRGRLMRVNDEG